MHNNHRHLFNKLVPILWEPGHMGAFFGRFLFDDVLEQSTLSEHSKQNYNKFPRFEWCWHDIIGEYFQYNLTDSKLKLHDSWDKLKQHFPEGVELDAAICYIVACQYYSCYSNTTRLPADVTHTQPFKKLQSTTNLIEIANSNFEFDNITFPYVKSHIQGNIKRINQFPWEKKIICRFPKNKSWMAGIFHFYKHYWYFIINPDSNSPGFSSHTKQALTCPVEYNKHFSATHDRYNPTDDIADYIIIDMYDLIFNENFEQLTAIDSRYNTGVSETQLRLIRDARQGSIEILNIFGLSHTADIVTEEDHACKFLTKEVIDIYNTVKKIGP